MLIIRNSGKIRMNTRNCSQIDMYLKEGFKRGILQCMLFLSEILISFYLKSVDKGNNEKLNKFKYTSIIPIQEIVVYKNEIIERRIQTC